MVGLECAYRRLCGWLDECRRWHTVRSPPKRNQFIIILLLFFLIQKNSKAHVCCVHIACAQQTNVLRTDMCLLLYMRYFFCRMLRCVLPLLRRLFVVFTARYF